jgi:DNA polymerase III subunit delta
MSPDQLLRSIAKQPPKPCYLFVGPDGYERDRCRRALLEAALPDAAEREEGYSRLDLAELTLAQVIDDAAAFSLFATRRLVWVSGAEAALPRRLTAEKEDAPKNEGVGLLKSWLANPNPDVVVVFDCSRYDFDGDDKAKLERVTKFYAAIPDVVEFPRYTPDAARALIARRAKELQLTLGAAESEFLVEALAADANRIMNELEKLSLCVGPGGRVTEETIAALVPNARTASVFALVDALGRGDRRRSLDVLDTLVREGEYLPIVLMFVATQLRLALAAHEAKATNAFQIQSHFQKSGVPMWKSKAEQVAATVAAFPRAKIEKAIANVAAADYAMRDIRPDDQTVMERLVFQLTAN